jgi:hypothetical protein
MNDNNSSMNQSNKRSDSHDLSLSNGCEYTKITNNNNSSKRRKLILHFDNRNTLQVSLFSYYFLIYIDLVISKVANNVSATTIEQGW